MKASLIFSSTSHSINVQKVRVTSLSAVETDTDSAIDLQDCLVQGIRSQVHDTRNRKRRRAASSLPSCLDAAQSHPAGGTVLMRDGTNVNMAVMNYLSGGLCMTRRPEQSRVWFAHSALLCFGGAEQRLFTAKKHWNASTFASCAAPGAALRDEWVGDDFVTEYTVLSYRIEDVVRCS